MIARQVMLTPLLLLAGCGGPAPEKAAKAKPPAAFPAGEWEVTATTTSLRSTDNTTPATPLKVGSAVTTKVCAAPGPAPDPALFVEKGDSCTATSTYARDGRINIAYTCKRPGRPGLVNPALDGKYDATSFEVAVATGTYFSGSGDYVLQQNMKGKRLGDCAVGAKPA